MAGVNSKIVQTSDGNLETFSLFWLDAQVNTTEDNRKTQQQLRQIINHLKTFDDQQQCQQHIQALSQQDRLVLIVSGRAGRQLVPQIHQLRQLSSVYVYCRDKKANEQWAKDYAKVKSVIIRLDDLIEQIKIDQTSRVKIEEPLAINVFTVSDNPDESTTALNGQFVHSLLLIDVLLRMKSIPKDKQQLITLCKNAYQGNNDQLAMVREFEEEYSADKALWWYTRESFLYKMLNKALRVQNIDLLFLFRFVIGDIYRQLQQHQCQSPIRVYRGQVMSNDELDTLQRSINEFISINSFFSTSINRHKAVRFLNSSDISNDLRRVLFVIDAHPDMVTTKPFADISSLSDFGNEGEVLFMIGCIFRLTEIRQDGEIWIIRMELCGDSEHDLKDLFQHMKKQYGGGDAEVDLRSFGEMLHEMGKYDLAEKVYRRLLEELPSNDPTLSNLYHSLGAVTLGQGEYDSSLDWYQKSLEVRMKTDPSDYTNIGIAFCGIGVVYWRKGDYSKALECQNKAIERFQEAHQEDHPHMAYFYTNIALAYYSQEKYSEALEFHEKSLSIYEKHYPSDHSLLATSHLNIGSVHYNLSQYDLAMNHYQQSLKVYLKSLPPQHPNIAASYKSIGAVHEVKGDLKEALTYLQKAATIYRHSLSPQHPDVIQIEKDIQHMSLKLK